MDVDADVVIGFGGYVALPAYLAARRAKRPIVVHEANIRPGLANRVGAKFTDHVLTGNPAVPMPGATCVGMPLRPAITGLDRAAMRAEARKAFGLDPERPTLLVTGGSQGARRLNDTMVASVKTLREAGIQVLHSYGGQELGGDSRPDPAGPPYVARPYVDRMDLAYAAADLAMTRSGMMTCSELAAVGLPSVYVPLPVGNGEQRLNAAPVVDAGGGLLIDDAALTPAWFAANVVPLLLDAERLATMSQAARGGSGSGTRTRRSSTWCSPRRARCARGLPLPRWLRPRTLPRLLTYPTLTSPRLADVTATAQPSDTEDGDR